MVKTGTYGSAISRTVTNIEGIAQKLPVFIWIRQGYTVLKNVFWEFTEHKKQWQ